MLKAVLKGIFRRWSRTVSPQGKVRSILVMEFTHIGDLVLSFPFLKEARRLFPEARLDVACGEWAKDVLSMSPAVDEVILFNHPLFDRSGRARWSCFWRAVRFLREVRRRRYDAVFEMRGNLGSAVLCLLSGGAYKSGRDVYGYGFPYDHALPPSDDHEAVDKLKLLCPFGGNLEPSWEALLPPGVEEGVRSAHPRLFEAPFLVFHTRTSWRPKDWGMRNFRALADRVLQRGVGGIALVGTLGDAQENRILEQAAPGRVFNLCGRLTIVETAAVIKNAAAFVGCDSGPAHLAALFGTSMVALMGPAPYPRYAPRHSGTAVRIVRHAVCVHQNRNDCRPIRDPEGCFAGENLCMKAIDVDEVESALQSLPVRQVFQS